MSGRTFLDTNILVYAYDAGEPEKQARSVAILPELVQRGEAVVSTQVLQEFYVVVTRKLAIPLPPAEAEQAVRDLARLPVVPTDRDLVLRAIRRSRDRVLSLWDALIVQAAIEAGCRRLLTEDLQGGATFESVEVVNPYAGL